MKVAIIGGSGNMGKWFARFLKEEDNDVVIIGRSETKLAAVAEELGVAHSVDYAAIKGCDAIILSIPIDSFEETVVKLAPHVSDEQKIFDLTSVKVKSVEIMHRLIKKGRLLGAHPVFGPGAQGLTKQHFVLTPTDDKEELLATKVKAYLEERGAIVSVMTPQEHDEMMAVILGLAHYIAIVSADTLLQTNSYRRMENISGITYRVLLTLVESVLSEDPELYASLQMGLPHLQEVQDTFKKSAADWSGLVKDGNRQVFIERLECLKMKLEKDNPNFGKAYANMYKLAEWL